MPKYLCIGGSNHGRTIETAEKYAAFPAKDAEPKPLYPWAKSHDSIPIETYLLHVFWLPLYAGRKPIKHECMVFTGMSQDEAFLQLTEIIRKN